MSRTCPLEATTLAFAYGEAPDAHALHVASCERCAGILEEHERVIAALGPALRAIGPPRAEGVPARRSRRLAAGAALIAAAAAAAVALSWSLPSPRAPAAPVAVAPIDGLDAALDDLDLELASLELETL